MPLLPLIVVVTGAALYAGRMQLRRRRTQRAAPRVGLPQRRLVDSPVDIASLSFTAALTGRIAYVPLAWAGGIGAAYNIAPIAMQSFDELLLRGRADLRLLHSGAVLLLLLSGHYVSATLLDLVTRYGSELGAEARRALTTVTARRTGEPRLPDAVWVDDGGIERCVPVTALTSGDIVVLSPGETVPTDGVISRGDGTVLALGQLRLERRVSRGSRTQLGERVLDGKLYVRCA
jgi:cation transport ATPase